MTVFYVSVQVTDEHWVRVEGDDPAQAMREAEAKFSGALDVQVTGIEEIHD